MIAQQLRKPWLIALFTTLFAIVIANLIAPPWRPTAVARMADQGLPTHINRDTAAHERATTDAMRALMQLDVEAQQQDREDRRHEGTPGPDLIATVVDTGVMDGPAQERIGQYLDRRVELLADLHELSQFEPAPFLPTANLETYPYNYNGLETHEVDTLLRLAALYGVRTGAVDQALNAIESMIAIARIFRSSPEAMDQLTVGSFSAMSIGSLLDVVASRPLTAAERNRVADAVASLRDLLDGYLVARSLTFLPETIQTIRDPWGLDRSGTREPGMRWVVNGLEATVGFDLHAYLSLSRDVADTLIAGDAIASKTDVARWQDQEHSWSRRRLAGHGDQYFSIYRSGYRSLRLQRIRLGAIDTFLAIEQYQDDTGALPESLADLVPNYLDAIPTANCFVVRWNWEAGAEGPGEALVFQRTDSGYQVRSQCMVRPGEVTVGRSDRLRQRDPAMATEDPGIYNRTERYLINIQIAS